MALGLIIGSTGAFLVLLAYLLLQTHKVTTHSIYYLLLNITGSLLLLAYAVIGKVIPFLALNIVWFVASLAKLLHVCVAGKKK